MEELQKLLAHTQKKPPEIRPPLAWGFSLNCSATPFVLIVNSPKRPGGLTPVTVAVVFWLV